MMKLSAASCFFAAGVGLHSGDRLIPAFFALCGTAILVFWLREET
jgi:hypothetical protein